MYKLITTVPHKDAEKVREALAQAGAGKIGNYTHCTFSIRGIGRFKANEGANPAIGTVGVLEEVEEEKIETRVCDEDLARVIEVLKAVHPYEEPVIDIYKLETL